jgi:hypothetical protein
MIAKLISLKVVSTTTLVFRKRKLQNTSDSKLFLKLSNFQNFVENQLIYLRNQAFAINFFKSSRKLFIATSMFPQR